jgi:hypothetical protein
MQPIKMLIAALALVAGAALAQPPRGGPGGFGGPGPGGSPAERLERLTVLLDLDPYQKQEVERVLTEQREAMQAERKAHDTTTKRPSFADMQARREQTREDTITKLQNVLTEQQITKLKLLMEPPPGAPRGRRGPPHDGGDPAAADDAK